MFHRLSPPGSPPTHVLKSALINRQDPLTIERLKEKQQWQVVRFKAPGIPLLQLLRLGLGKIGNAISDTLGAVFGPLFWYAFEANLRNGMKEYNALRHSSKHQHNVD